MFSNNCKYPVRKVRIATESDQPLITYDQNPTIEVVRDPQRKLEYLRIENDGKLQFSQVFDELKWIPQSSTDTVITIRSLKHTIVIVSDGQNTLLREFFAMLQKSLSNEIKNESQDLILSRPDPGQLKSLIDRLIQSISSGDSNTAEDIAGQLANYHVNMQFNLVNRKNSLAKDIPKPKSDADMKDSLHSILRLSLQVECSYRDPLNISIKVRPGTTLRALKTQIETDTGIKYHEQYWFAFKRHPIPDDYIFGSSNSLKINGKPSLDDCIQSGDTLIMYIT